MFFSKYSASGNDFIISHFFKYTGISYSKLAQKICDRYNGVGADGLIILKPHDIYSYEWEFYNKDGSSANMCGNGSRAVGMYASDNNLAPSKHTFLSGAGAINIEINDNIVESELGIGKILDNCILEYDVKWWLLDTGVPHLVAFGDEVFGLDSKSMLEMRLKYNANVNVARVDSANVLIRTFERGVEGETLACGTGMAAMFYRMIEEGYVDNNCLFNPASGENVYLRREDNRLFLKGEVRKICDFIYHI